MIKSLSKRHSLSLALAALAALLGYAAIFVAFLSMVKTTLILVFLSFVLITISCGLKPIMNFIRSFLGLGIKSPN